MNDLGLAASAQGMRPVVEPARWSFDHEVNAARGRRWARQVLTVWQAGLFAEDALLVVAELIQNVLQHTTGGGKVTLTPLRNAVLVEVFDPCPKLPYIREADPRRLGGRGLVIVAAVSHEWGVRSMSSAVGKVVWARLASPPG